MKSYKLCTSDIVILACSVILMIIWPIIGTIALRNLLLAIGATTSIVYLFRAHTELFEKSALPIVFLGLFFFWIVIHYYFFAFNPERELEQLRGQWLRIFLATLLGITVGLKARNNSFIQFIAALGMAAFTIVFYINYVWLSVTNGRWEVPYFYELGFYGDKIRVVYFGMLSLAFGLSIATYILHRTQSSGQRWVIPILIYCSATFFTFTLVGSKSGIAQGFIFSLVFIGSLFLKKNKSTVAVIASLVFSCLLLVAGIIHKSSTTEWDNFFASVAAGTQIDKYKNWQNYDLHRLPTLDDGTKPRESAYVRSAWATAGVTLLRENPTGFGLINDSFKHLAKRKYHDVENFYVVSTLSGWLDFSLGVGIPGLLLVWAAIFSSLYFSRRKDDPWACSTKWILSACFLSFTVAEISDDHFLEPLFFLTAAVAAGNIKRASSFKEQERRHT